MLDTCNNRIKLWGLVNGVFAWHSYGWLRSTTKCRTHRYGTMYAFVFVLVEHNFFLLYHCMLDQCYADAYTHSLRKWWRGISLGVQLLLLRTEQSQKCYGYGIILIPKQWLHTWDTVKSFLKALNFMTFHAIADAITISFIYGFLSGWSV